MKLLITAPPTVSTPSVKENTRKRRSANLKKKPLQILIMKKYRPKVIVEGKPIKTPRDKALKPSTLEPQTPNPSIPKRATSKRKYVRKNSLQASANSSEILDEQAVYSSGEYAAKSCKRVLKFDLKNKCVTETVTFKGSLCEERKNVKNNLEASSNSSVESNPEYAEKSCSRALNFNLQNQVRNEKDARKFVHQVRPTIQTGCGHNSVQVYQRKFQENQCLKNSRKLGPNFPKTCKKKMMKRQKATSRLWGSKVYCNLVIAICNPVMENKFVQMISPTKEQTIEEQREVFRGRVDSFIACMHLIQGDRHFSPWKGSVVDSVVGAYLTQNVSDRHSSSAFMSLSAQFPIRSTSNHREYDDDAKNACSQELVRIKIGAYGNVNDANDKQSRNIVSGGIENVKQTSDLTKKKRKKSKVKDSIDWDDLRKAYSTGRTRESSANTMDSLDWEGVGHATVEDVSKTIMGRGMNNVLGARIKKFLNLMVKDHGSIDLEWLREVPPDKAKEYLLSIRGLGLKSVECIRLLTLHQVAFPVDTNVGRVVVRLGWVPLQKLPEGVHLHHLNQYELHAQLITFGKVFCTKKDPNCKACPMRGECSHYASALASETVTLPRSKLKNASRLRTQLQVEPVTLPRSKLNNASRLRTQLQVEPVTLPRSKLNNASQLRTQLQVYELPDSHLLLARLNKREPDDPCPYLFSVWTTGETVKSSEQPKKRCNSQESEVCKENSCFSCSNIQEQNFETVCGTILIPCRTATRGSFPLNGTYFQVNEVFADYESSQHPINVSRELIWNLPRRTLYCGTSAATIFRGLSTEEIQNCFSRGGRPYFQWRKLSYYKWGDQYSSFFPLLIWWKFPI